MNGQDTFLWGLQINDSLTTELTAQMTVIALGVAVICFICNIAYNYLYHGVSQLLTSDENKFPDLMEIARCFALIFCLSLYTPIAKTVVGTLEVINEATSLSSVRAQEFAAFLDRSAEEQHTMIADNEKTALEAEVAAGEDPEGAMNKELQNIDQGNKIDESASTLKQISQILNPANFAAMLLHALAALLVGIVQIIILGLGVVIVKILVILGPFVFAFSILPVFQKQLSNWFGTLCSVGMVFTVINILNQIMWFTFKLNSTCKCNRILINNLFKFFVWREVSKSFTRSIIEFIFNPLNLFVGYFTKVLTLWDILPDKPVGVFIGTTFP